MGLRVLDRIICFSATRKAGKYLSWPWKGRTANFAGFPSVSSRFSTGVADLRHNLETRLWHPALRRLG